MKRTPWPRWAKILRNLLLIALLGLLMWDTWDQPTFSYLADLRRRERKALFPEENTGVELTSSIGTLYRREVPYRIEVAGDMAVTSFPLYGDFFTTANTTFHRLKEGPNLICASLPVELPDEYGQPLTYVAYAAVRPPEDAVDAVLTLCIHGGEYVVEDFPGNGIFLFFARPERDENGKVVVERCWFLPEDSAYETDAAYEVKFFDIHGTEVGRISG